jgi:NADH-quinone oxidoreductase subunit I
MGHVPGTGLTKALAQTIRRMAKPAVTTQYPDVLPDLPPRSRGVIALIEENCTVCMLCARECPDWCIYIDSHKEEQPPATPGGRARQRNVLDRFAIDFSLCMYCGICVEVCPFDALFWSPEFEYAEFDIRDLTQEKDRLREWMWTVPPPPAHDERAADPKELEAATKPPAPKRGAPEGERPARPERAARSGAKPAAAPDAERPVGAGEAERPVGTGGQESPPGERPARVGRQRAASTTEGGPGPEQKPRRPKPTSHEPDASGDAG